MKIVCGLVENICDNSCSFWDFRYLKVNCNLNVKRILNCSRLFGNRHPMFKTSERYFLMGLLQQNVKSSGLEVYSKKGVLKNFAKFTEKHPCWSLFLIWDYRDSSAGVFLWIFTNTFFVEHLATVVSETYTMLVSRKSFKVILGEKVQSSGSYSSILSLYLYIHVIIPETIREINVLWHDVHFYVIQKRRIQNPVSNITIKLFCSNSWLLYGSIYLMKLLGWPSRYLFVENKRCKHRNNKWNLFKVNNEDTWTASLTSLWCLYC